MAQPRDRSEAIAVAVVVAAFLLAGGFALVPPHGLFREPHSPTKALALAAVALTALAAPLAFAEATADRRFLKEERRLRAARAWGAVAPYDGPDGSGLVFEAPDARVLLLRPEGGLGLPVVVEAPLPAPQPPEPEAPPADGREGGDSYDRPDQSPPPHGVQRG